MDTKSLADSCAEKFKWAIFIGDSGEFDGELSWSGFKNAGIFDWRSRLPYVAYPMTHLAQIGFPVPTGDDLVKGVLWSLLRIAAWGAIALIALVLLILGLIGIRRRRGKIMALCGGLILIAAAVTAYISYIAPDHRLTIDLSSSQTPPSGKWSSMGDGSEMLCIQGRVDVDMKLPGERRFDGRASLVILNRKGGLIHRVSIQHSGLSLREACNLTAHYLKDWNLNYKNFDQWCADRRAGKRDVYQETEFYSYLNNANPSIALELRKFGDSWTLNLSIDWRRPGDPQ